MILKYTKGSKSFRFYDDSYNNNSNIFTVIVGKNGTGKSRLLIDIISNFIPINEFNSIRTVARDRNKVNKKIELEISQKPNKLIAVSTSPYDKFPLPRVYSDNLNINEFYSYIGIRNLRTVNFSLGFMSKIIGQLLLVRSMDTSQFSKIAEVLNYLGYSDEIHVIFEFRINYSLLDDLIKSSDPEKFFFEISDRSTSDKLSLQFLKTEDNKFDFYKFERLINILQQLNDIHSRRKRLYTLIFDSKSINSEINIEDISFLIEAGIARLRDVDLKKLNTDKTYKISEASSGEQCVFTTLVGISCNISDNSLILIDEPEISLHPEWQEKYIQLLMKTFQNYKNCHFIIATHSPQLISKLSMENCFILQMDNKELKNAKFYVNNSVDFQLANIFNSPGFKNEYLLRIAMNIFSNLSKNKSFGTVDLENLQILENQSIYLKENDPVFDLYKTIVQLKKIYK